MNNPDLSKHLHAMFDAHNVAFAAIRRTNASLREANTANGVAIAAIGEANTAIGAAFDAHEEVIDAALAANQAAIDMLHALGDQQ
jgi:hypothetical protein